MSQQTTPAYTKSTGLFGAKDTIVAPATAPGQGGIGIVRVSGPQALTLLTHVFVPAALNFSGFKPWTLHRGSLLDAEKKRIDDALAVFMPGPRTFTGDDVVELHCHGSPALMGLILDSLCALGARLAERGEFSRRAFLNGRMDLTQAEAVAELIAAPGPEAARLASARLEGQLGARVGRLREQIDTLRAHVCLAVDFPDDEIDAELTPANFRSAADVLDRELSALIHAFERTRVWREGVTVVLAGPVNAGKSSLLNLLLGRDRALVSASPGTTRDYLEETVRLGSLPLRLIDTAGLREDPEQLTDPLEAEGIRRALKLMEQADAVLLLLNGMQPDQEQTTRMLRDFDPSRTVLIWNKIDCAIPAPWFTSLPAAAHVALSARSGDGLSELEAAMRSLLAHRTGLDEPETDMLAPNLRQTESLRLARQELRELVADVAACVPWDLCAVQLESVAATLEQVTGQASPEEVLNKIFSSFCIGK